MGVPGPGRVGRLIELWPVLLLTFVYILSYFSPDYIIAPLLFGYGYSQWTVLVIVGAIGFLELLGGYTGWSRTRTLVERWLSDDIDFLKKIKGELEAQGYIDWMKIYFSRKYLNFLNNNGDELQVKRGWFNRILDKFLKNIPRIAKSGGYLGVFLLGITPIPGFRVAPDIFCGTTRWKKGFFVLAVGNFLKTAALVHGWGWIFS